MIKDIALESVKLNPAIFWALEAYKELAKEGKVGENHLRANDYRRWSLVYDLLPSGVSLMDIGIGAGQFVNAAANDGKFSSVRGVDYRETSGLNKIHPAWDLELRSLAEPGWPQELSAQYVTCMECIEHIADPGFDVAVENLKRCVSDVLIVTVPFEEEEPLPKYHKQRFDADRLYRHFPGGELTTISSRGRPMWALIRWTP